MSIFFTKWISNVYQYSICISIVANKHANIMPFQSLSTLIAKPLQCSVWHSDRLYLFFFFFLHTFWNGHINMVNCSFGLAVSMRFNFFFSSSSFHHSVVWTLPLGNGRQHWTITMGNNSHMIDTYNVSKYIYIYKDRCSQIYIAIEMVFGWHHSLCKISANSKYIYLFLLSC